MSDIGQSILLVIWDRNPDNYISDMGQKSGNGTENQTFCQTLGQMHIWDRCTIGTDAQLGQMHNWDRCTYGTEAHYGQSSTSFWALAATLG